MREECPYSELFSPNAGKYRPDNSGCGHFLRSVGKDQCLDDELSSQSFTIIFVFKGIGW